MKAYRLLAHFGLLSMAVTNRHLLMVSAANHSLSPRKLQSNPSSWNIVTEITGTTTFQIGLKHSLDLTYNGMAMAVSSMYSSDGGKSDQGEVRVYDIDSSSQVATQRGNALFGPTRNQLFGSSVCLADGGELMFVGAQVGDSNYGVSIYLMRMNIVSITRVSNFPKYILSDYVYYGIQLRY